jgi:hypothetical protein
LANSGSKLAYKDTGLIADFEFRDSIRSRMDTLTISDDVSVPLDSCHRLFGTLTNTFPKNPWLQLSAISGCFRTCSDGGEIIKNKVITPISLNENINIYPNPSPGLFNIGLKNLFGPNALVSIYDINGHMVYSNRFSLFGETPTLNEINLTRISKGVYFLNIVDAKNSYNKKVFVE